LQSIVPPVQGQSSVGSNPTPSTSYSSAMAASLAQQQHSKHGQQSQLSMPSAADLSLLLSLGMGGLDASQLANLDLQKLAMYLVSIVSQCLSLTHTHKHTQMNFSKFF
jgi:chromodomain-helicase-DNA-binding protein 7